MEPITPKNLVLEGGGVLGCAHCGALVALEELGFLREITNFAGTSIGAIIAGALACGASAEYVLQTMLAADFTSFVDYGNAFVAFYNFMRYKGICQGETFCEWYSEIIYELTGNKDITLAEVHDRFGGRLAIVLTDIDARKSVTADFRSHPHWPLVKVVRAAMSIPGLFVPVELDGVKYVDGGLINNMPMKAFHRDGPHGDVINPLTLGLMLVTQSEMEEKYPPVSSVISYIEALYDCGINKTQNQYMDAQDWARTVKIPCAGSSMDFNIPTHRKAELVKSGYDTVIQYFEEHGAWSQIVGSRAAAPTMVNMRGVSGARSGWNPDDERGGSRRPPLRVVQRVVPRPAESKPIPVAATVDAMWSEIETQTLAAESTKLVDHGRALPPQTESPKRDHGPQISKLPKVRRGTAASSSPARMVTSRMEELQFQLDDSE